MLTAFPRRSFRRPAVIVLVFFSLALLLSYLRDSSVASAPRFPLPRSKPAHTVTVFKTRTAWARTTRTVIAGGAQQTEPPSTEASEEPSNGNQAQDSSSREDVEVPFIKPKKHKAALANHLYRSDGLVQVHPDGSHPIYELVKRAEKEWQRRLDRASKTLDEAVKEYERRYKRPPPLGFDDWWAYVQENNVQLPDEYDRIYQDLEPYWGMDPNDLQALQHEWEAHADSYTIGKVADGKLQILNHTLPYDEKSRTNLMWGGRQIVEMLEDVQEYIPPFRAIFSPHDNPNLHIDWELRQMAIKAAAAGKYIDIKNPPEVKLHGWISSCDPRSPAWRDPISWNTSPPPPNENTPKTFIYDHRLAMDPCIHPSHLLLHGQFISHHTGPVPHRFMPPQFSYCATTLHHDILPANAMNWVEDVSRDDDPEFRMKKEERLQWRGTNTGIWHAKGKRWWDAQRVRLIRWAETVENPVPGTSRHVGVNGDEEEVYYYGDNVTVLPPWTNEGERLGAFVRDKRSKWAPAMLDVAFAGEPNSCEKETCSVLRRTYEYRRAHNIKAQGQYKYILDVDGNGWSSRFKRLITTNSLIFKSTIYPEWYLDRIMPWVHYVPVKLDLTDLYDSLAFFRGDPSGRGAHEDMAEKIAKAGREWSLKFWRKEDLVAYNFRLFLEYARVMSPQRDQMSYVHLTSGEKQDKKRGAT
ncbi:hypothetical protein AX16_005084 [Volvariella volvacea WC 439]|nr:hypothetical protein AX16_005084 [Volvariella volvacea WC 439]